MHITHHGALRGVIGSCHRLTLADFTEDHAKLKTVGTHDRTCAWSTTWRAATSPPS